MRLVTQAQLIAELLSQSSQFSSDQDLDDEADRLAELIQRLEEHSRALN